MKEVTLKRRSIAGLSHFAPHALIVVGFLVRAAHLTQESLWRDEVDTIRFAFASLTELIGNLSRNGFNGPLYHLIMRAWLSLGGVHDVTVRYFSLLCGVLLVALVFVLARRLFGRWAALLAAWLVTFAPVLIWYSVEGKMYTFQPALLVLAIYALCRAVGLEGADITNGGVAPPRTVRRRASVLWWTVFIVATSLAYYVHLLTPLFLAVGVTFYIVWWPRSRRHWRGALIALAVSTLPYVPMALWQWPLFVAGGDTGHTFYTLDTTIRSLLYNWSLGLSDWLLMQGLERLEAPLVLLFIMALAVGLTGAFLWRRAQPPARRAGHRHKPVRVDAPVSSSFPVASSALGVLGWLLLPPLLVYLISTRAPVFEPRYVLWAAPAYYILIGAGLAWLRARVPIVAGGLLVVLSLSSAGGMTAQRVLPIRPDMRGAAQAVAAQMQPGDLFVFQIPYTRYAFEYYLPKFAPHLPVDPAIVPDDGLQTLLGLGERIVDAPYTNAGITPEELDHTLRPLLGRSQRIWLVEAEADLWDGAGLVRGWHEQNLALRERYEKRGVTASLYQLELKNQSFLPILRR